MSCNKKPCGCGDTPLNTQPPCNESGDCSGEKCSELFCQECIVYCSDTMVATVNGETLTIEKGAGLDVVLQKLLAFMDTADCGRYAAVGLKVLAKGTDFITLAWEADAALAYTLTYAEGANSFDVDVSGLSAYKIENLIPDTEYSIVINATGPGCASVTLKVKTNRI